MADTGSTKIWMPWCIGDYLADTARLTTEQHGAYLLLLADYWRSGPLPDDEAVLAQVTKLSPSGWRKHSPVIRSYFTKGADGLLHQKRSDLELAKAKTNRDKARTAADRRWGKDDSSIAQASPQASLEHVLEGCTSPSPVPLPASAPEATPASPAKTIPSPVAKRVSSKDELVLLPPVADKPKKGSDPRFTPFKNALSAYYRDAADMDMSTGPQDFGQIAQFLSANPSLTDEDLSRIVANRKASAGVVHSQRPSQWLSFATNYLCGPLAAYGKPLGVKGALYDQPVANAKIGATHRECAQLLELEELGFTADLNGRGIEAREST